MSNNTILLIGQNGQVSTYLQRIMQGDFTLHVAGREQLDLSRPNEIQAVLKEIAPTLIINPAAYTAVDLAEQEVELADIINHTAVAEIATYSARSNTPLIHFSTDYVFDGQANTPYVETDAPAPTGIYGASKLAGEKAIIKTKAPALILRTSWVYSNVGKNFYKTMLALAETRSELSVVADQIGAPTYAGSIARACGELANVVLQQGAITNEQIGIYHLTCQGQTSWCEFAKAIFAANEVEHMQVKAISTKDYPTPAARPPFSVLATQKLQDQFNIQLPHWQAALSECAVETRANT